MSLPLYHPGKKNIALRTRSKGVSKVLKTSGAEPDPQHHQFQNPSGSEEGAEL